MANKVKSLKVHLQFFGKKDNRLKEIEDRLEEIRGMMDDDEKRGDAKFSDLEKEVRDLKEEKSELEARQRMLDDQEKEHDGNKKDKERDDDKKDDDEIRDKKLNDDQRDALGNNLAGKGNSAEKREKEVRKAFGRFVVGQITETEARELGIVTGNGAITVPKQIAKEVISYAQENNPLRKYGTPHRTKTTQGFPILVKKANAQGHKDERTTSNPMPETSIEFDEIELEPTEFDALATVTKKLLKRSDIAVEEIVIEELKKAYVRKESQYFFRGDEVNNLNPGALAKKAVAFTIPDGERPDLKVGQQVYDALVDFKNSVIASVRKRSMFMINDAALSLIEKMKTTDGFPIFKPFEQARDGFDGKILGFNTVVTEFADKSDVDPDTPMIYFGDFKTFHYQDVMGSMEVNRLVELYAKSNLVGLQIYNIVDGQLIYSPLEPTMYKYEVVPNTPAP
ncbi:phage major capsid protein [Virgibacillus halodenitrificans]|nr:phage major capsid protein [Virgibacillus halodenitrificans]